jgi:predicted Co/Zn/Cd cation transporter (cation efflux family)
MPYDPIKVPAQSRGLSAITGVMALIVILLVVQIWLLSATLDSFLAGRHSAAIPGAIVSGIIFAVCFGFYLFVERIDKHSRDNN